LSSSTTRWSDFGIRLASAAVLAPLAILALWSGGLAWFGLIGLFMLGLGAEWQRLAGLKKAVFLLPAILAVVLLVAIWWGWAAGFLAMAVLTLICGAYCGWFAAIGIPYAAIGALALMWLRIQPDDGLGHTVLLVVVVWATDIGAYVVGRLIGGRKLAPSISPGKTLSGAWGGLACGGIAGLVVGHFGLTSLIVALILSACAQAGDLLESAIKRKLGVKDSGRTIPGHGGLFDRLDGFLSAAPVAAILALIAHGGFLAWG